MSVERENIIFSDGKLRIYVDDENTTVDPKDIIDFLENKLEISIGTLYGSSCCTYKSFVAYKDKFDQAKNDIKFMNEALAEAYKGIARREGGPFGSIVVMNGQVIGKGHNNVLKNNDPTAHGEITAIREACKNFGKPHLDGAILYTTSYPCPMCLAAMMWAHIDTFYYGCTIEDAKRIGFDDSSFYKRFNNTKDGKIKNIQLMHNECLQLFDYYETLEHETY